MSLYPNNENIKILLPITLLAASESLPFKIELKLTNNSGELVPRETTVKPITIWGIPKIKDKNIAPWIKNSPPVKSRTTPKTISIIGNKNHSYLGFYLDNKIFHNWLITILEYL